MVSEVGAEIFKYIDVPISLILVSKDWHAISKIPLARADWLIYKYGKVHALFHAVRLGEGFLNSEVLQILLDTAILSRYFMQRLFLQYGKFDQKLLKLKLRYNANNPNLDKIRIYQDNQIIPWASDISFQVFYELMMKALETFIEIKGNDLELFLYLSGGPLPTNDAQSRLEENLNKIDDLIINKKFVPFPPRPNLDNLEPRKDGYEHEVQLRVVARAISIRPELTDTWKNIGYTEICQDLNQFVMEACFNTFFLSNRQSTPSEEDIVDFIRKYTSRGFKVTNFIMENVFNLLESQLGEIGELLINSFKIIHEESGSIMDYKIIERFNNIIFPIEQEE